MPIISLRPFVVRQPCQERHCILDAIEDANRLGFMR